jgi:hypothetical protein
MHSADELRKLSDSAQAVLDAVKVRDVYLNFVDIFEKARIAASSGETVLITKLKYDPTGDRTIENFLWVCNKLGYLVDYHVTNDGSLMMVYNITLRW